MDPAPNPPPQSKRQRKLGEDPAGWRQAGLCVRPCTQARSSRLLLTLPSATPEDWALGKLFSLKPSGQRFRSAGALLNVRGRRTRPRPTSQQVRQPGWLRLLLPHTPPTLATPGRHSGPQLVLQDRTIPSPPTLSSPARNRRGSHGPAQTPPRGNTHVVGEGVGRDPHDRLAQHLGLVVDAFDGQEDLRRSRRRRVRPEAGGRGGWGRGPAGGPGLTLRRARAAMT